MALLRDISRWRKFRGVYRTNPRPRHRAKGDCVARQKSETWGRRGPLASLLKQWRRQPEAPTSRRMTMAFRLSIRRAMLLAGTLGTLTVYPALGQQQPAPGAAPAPTPAPAAQAPAAAPLPPGSPLIGRPSTEGAMKLAPIAPPPIPTAADKLPVRASRRCRRASRSRSGLPASRTPARCGKATRARCSFPAA